MAGDGPDFGWKVFRLVQTGLQVDRKFSLKISGAYMFKKKFQHCCPALKPSSGFIFTNAETQTQTTPPPDVKVK